MYVVCSHSFTEKSFKNKFAYVSHADNGYTHLSFSFVFSHSLCYRFFGQQTPSISSPLFFCGLVFLLHTCLFFYSFSSLSSSLSFFSTWCRKQPGSKNRFAGDSIPCISCISCIPCISCQQTKEKEDCFCNRYNFLCFLT